MNTFTILNDLETYTDMDGTMVLIVHNKEILDEMDGGEEIEYILDDFEGGVDYETIDIEELLTYYKNNK